MSPGRTRLAVGDGRARGQWDEDSQEGPVPRRLAAARVLIVRDFLDAAACRAIQTAMDAGPTEPGEVLAAHGVTLDQDARRVSHVDIGADLGADIERRLDAWREAVSTFYEIPLSAREGPSFLRYDPGGFYGPHRDRGLVPSWPEVARRRIAVVAFLNSSRTVDPHADFSGGALRLFADSGEPVDVHPVRGTLIAFHAAVLHEVTVVRDGPRYTVVDWFC